MGQDKHYWQARCPKCDWTGSTWDCFGGDPIADTGDFDDPVCPVCYRERYEWVAVKEVE